MFDEVMGGSGGKWQHKCWPLLWLGLPHSTAAASCTVPLKGEAGKCLPYSYSSDKYSPSPESRAGEHFLPLEEGAGNAAVTTLGKCSLPFAQVNVVSCL